MPDLKRRDFLRQSSAAAAAASFVGPARWAGANDRIRVAVLGLGNRGRGHIREAASVENVEVATICDPDQTRMERSASDCEKAGQRRPKCEADLRRVLEDKTIDVISVATPNHWHALATIWACQAGKHVYAEKPVAHNLEESRRMLEVVRKSGRIVAAGTQRRSNPNFKKMVRLLRKEGAIGDIYMARAEYPQPRDPIGTKPVEAPPSTLHWDLWLGPAREQPYKATWCTTIGTGSGTSATAISGTTDPTSWTSRAGGSGRVSRPAFSRPAGASVPRTRARLPTPSEPHSSTTTASRWSMTSVGLYSGNSGSTGNSTAAAATCTSRLRALGSRLCRLRVQDLHGPQQDSRARPQRAALRAKAADHYRNFITAVRAGKREMLNSDLEEGHISGGLCLLANISYRLGREVRFDLGRERFVSDSEADKYLTRQYRKPFAVPREGLTFRPANAK